MPIKPAKQPVRIAIVGSGKVSDYHHVPGIRLDDRCTLVAACDADAKLLEPAQGMGDREESRLIGSRFARITDIDAVIIATPNFTHRPIAVAAAKAGKHVMCEKPLGLTAGEVREMYMAARDAGVVHMTAFTYRFAPPMRYLRHLVKNGGAGQAAAFSQPAVFGLARNQLGLAAIQGQSRGGRFVRHDDPSYRFCDRSDGSDQKCVRRGGAVRRSARKRLMAKRARLPMSTIGRA